MFFSISVFGQSANLIIEVKYEISPINLGGTSTSNYGDSLDLCSSYKGSDGKTKGWSLANIDVLRRLDKNTYNGTYWTTDWHCSNNGLDCLKLFNFSTDIKNKLFHYGGELSQNYYNFVCIREIKA